MLWYFPRVCNLTFSISQDKGANLRRTPCCSPAAWAKCSVSLCPVFPACPHAYFTVLLGWAWNGEYFLWIIITYTYFFFFFIDATFQLFQLYHNSGCQLICDMCLPQQSKLIVITFCLALFKQAAPSAIQIACSWALVGLWRLPSCTYMAFPSLNPPVKVTASAQAVPSFPVLPPFCSSLSLR